MKNDIFTAKDRLIFLQSKHDRTDKRFLFAIGCLGLLEVMAQIAIAIG